MDVVAVILASLFVALGFVALTLVCAMAVGLEIQTVSIGSFVPLGSWNLKGVTLKLSAIPFGSYVKFRDLVSGDEPEPFSQFYMLPLGQSLFVVLVPNLVILLAGVLTYFFNPGRAFQLGSLFLIWSGLTALLPFPGAIGYLVLLRAITPQGQAPRSTPPTWLAGTTIMLLFGSTLLVLWLLAFRGDAVLVVVERFLSSHFQMH